MPDIAMEPTLFNMGGSAFADDGCLPLRPVRNLILFLAIFLVGGCASPKPPNAQILPEASPVAVRSSDSVSASSGPSSWELFAALEMLAVNDALNPILPDDYLAAKFRVHRAVFEQLRQMIAADPKLRRVDYDWTNPRDPEDAGVSPERIQKYRTLLDEAGCPRGFVANPGSIYFISAAQGTVIASRDQGFYYSEVAPAPLVTNTITYRPTGTVDSWKAFKHIEGNWYICYVEN